MKKTLKSFLILLIVVFSMLICNNVFATENEIKEVGYEIIDKNETTQTMLPPNSGGFNAYIDSSLNYQECKFLVELEGEKNCQYEDSFTIDNLGTFKKTENLTITDMFGSKYTYDVVYITDITDQSILKTGKFTSKKFKVKNLTTGNYEDFKINLLCFKNQFGSNANLSINGVDFIENGKIIIEDKEFNHQNNIYACYDRVHNCLRTVNCQLKDIKFNNMGNNFHIWFNDEIIHCNTGIQIKQNDNISTDSILKADTITKGTVYDNVVNSIGTEYKNLQVYDISIEDSNNTKIQPNGKIQLSIPIKNKVNTSNLVVYRIENNGNKIQYDVTVKNENGQDYAVFETDHFSTYVLAERKDKVTEIEQTKEEVQDDTNNKHILDNEPKTGTYIKLTTIISSILIISIFSIIIIKIKE